MIYLLLVIICVIYTIYLIKKRVQAHFELLEGMSDDINEIRMKLGLGKENRTEQQAKEYIEKETEELLVAGKGIKEINDYFFSLDDSGIPARYAWRIIEGHKRGRKKYNEFIKELIKDFDEAKICPRCKEIYYSYTEVDSPHDLCVECSRGKPYAESVKLITTTEYVKQINKDKIVTKA